jgi:hypothetical protein
MEMAFLRKCFTAIFSQEGYTIYKQGRKKRYVRKLFGEAICVPGRKAAKVSRKTTFQGKVQVYPGRS